jgi:hypothetical protein
MLSLVELIQTEDKKPYVSSFGIIFCMKYKYIVTIRVVVHRNDRTAEGCIEVRVKGRRGK